MSSQIAPSPFVVDSLRPQGSQGRGRLYQLDANSASPTVVVGYDELGMPIEETVPHTHWRAMVHPAGGINKVTLRTCAPADMEPEGVRYENQQMTELIGSGWLPLSECPYTFAYAHIKGGPLIKVPAGEKDCGGAPEGCKHVKEEIAKRLAVALKKHNDLQAKAQSMKTEDVERMMGIVGDAIKGQTEARTAAKSRLVKGEQD